MEDYVVPDFYDVMVGEGTGTSGGGNSGQVVTASGSLKWDLTGGVTGIARQLVGPNTGVVFEIFDGDTDAKVKARFESLTEDQQWDVLTKVRFSYSDCK